MFLQRKLKTHTNISSEMQELIEGLKGLPSKEDCLLKVYTYLSDKYHGSRVKTYTRVYELLYTDIDELWKKTGYLHCTNINYLAKYLLVHSGHFEEADISLKWTRVWFISPHQYLKIRMNDNVYVNIDVWAKIYGVGYGDFAKGIILKSKK
ncbi:MAG: hypothetical protein ACPGO5_01445 [Patescibacteria group bacterium]